MRRRGHKQLDPKTHELYVRYFRYYLEGKRRDASTIRIVLRRLLLRSCISDKSAYAAIALGDISLHTKTGYRYYCMAVDYDPGNVEALSHAALDAARLGLDKAAQSFAYRAIKIGFSKYRAIKDVLLHDLFLAAALIENNRLMTQLNTLVKNRSQYDAEIRQERSWRIERLRRKR